MIKTPYLLFLGDAADQLAAKVAQGIADWRPGNAVGQFRMEGCQADVGLPDMTLDEARAAGAETLVIGVANRGGMISGAWLDVLVEAMEKGFDVASGLHNLLRDEAGGFGVGQAVFGLALKFRRFDKDGDEGARAEHDVIRRHMAELLAHPGQIGMGTQAFRDRGA